MNREILLTTFLLTAMIFAGFAGWMAIRKSTSMQLVESKYSAEHVKSFELDFHKPTSKKALPAIVEDEPEVLRICQGNVFRMSIGKDGKEHSSRAPATLVFLKAPPHLLHISTAKYEAGEEDELFDATTAKIQSIEQLRREAYESFEDLIDDAVEICIGTGLSPEQLVIEAANLRDEIENEVTVALRVDKISENLKAKLILYYKNKQELVEKTFDFNDYSI